jgi:hypothetical protein
MKPAHRRRISPENGEWGTATVRGQAFDREAATPRSLIRFSRHARNKLRHARISPADARDALAGPREIGEDRQGNVAVTAEVAGRSVTFIIAVDDPRLVITVILRRS